MKFAQCNCMTKTPEAKYHKHGCPVREGIKFPVLFYYEDAVDSFIPAPEHVENMISVEDQLVDGETIEWQLKRIDMTDKELDDLPEC